MPQLLACNSGTTGSIVSLSFAPSESPVRVVARDARFGAADPVPGYTRGVGCPGHGGHAVAKLDAVEIQPLRRLHRAIANFGVICTMDGAFDRPRHDFLRSMDSSRVLDNPVTKQRPVLHQSKHTNVPPGGVTACRRLSRNCHEL